MFRLALAFTAFVSATAPGSQLLISSAELAARLDDPSMVVLHVADRESAFLDGHIPGARFIRYADIAIDGSTRVGTELPPIDQVQRIFEAAGVSDSSQVVIYSASTVLAARAFFTLDVVGHARVALLDGGLTAWKAEHRPIEAGPRSAPKPGKFTPRLNAARVVDAAFVQQQIPARAVALVDVRPDPEFLGTDGGMSGVHSAGHIEGAQQLPWTTLVGEDGRFLPAAALEGKLRAAGADPGKPVVSYCMVGMRASVVYFVARYLGYDARLYDGSIVDWSQRKLPTKMGRQ